MADRLKLGASGERLSGHRSGSASGSSTPTLSSREGSLRAGDSLDASLHSNASTVTIKGGGEGDAALDVSTHSASVPELLEEASLPGLKTE